jgi:hypothetical protein
MYTEALREELTRSASRSKRDPSAPAFLESDGSHKVTATNHIPELEAATQTKSRLAAKSHHQPAYTIKGAQLIVEVLPHTG